MDHQALISYVDDPYLADYDHQQEFFTILDELYIEELHYDMIEDEFDDFHFSSAVYQQEEIFPISDETYAEELQLEEALMSSAIISTRKWEKLEMENNWMEKEKEKVSKRSETGKYSQSFCLICMDTKPAGEMFRNNTCVHIFCADCIRKYIASKIKENISMVKCSHLNCKGVLDPQVCRSIVTGEVFDRWENALCESMILVAQKFYCPFKDCSAMLVDDGRDVVTVSECPNCRRLFCAMQGFVACRDGVQGVPEVEKG
ncbi:probable E3 ubiquitin-protein ligase ARI3 [Cornus florida]|uniref:probable E3 ubiquitin-protein ligase ARI3 n=1 Tax=Cornus florida TaxID=4283 RepID=UPI0028A253D1|nr:probable E3 ubiquitin-protein ligase ARI3 [Cornus florida]